MLTHSPRAFPLGDEPPVGAHHVKGKRRRPARGRRPRPRICLRKGCGRKYQPRCWNQRYCQEPECQREVRRWQAARRQAKHRQDAEAKARHAQAERDAPPAGQVRVPGCSAAQKLRRRVVTQQKLFFPSFMRSARLPRITRDLAPQPGTLLLPRLPSGGSQCPGSGTQVARLAAPWMAGRSGPSSTKPRAGAGPCGDATPPPRRHRGRLRSDDSSRARRSSIIAWLLEAG